MRVLYLHCDKIYVEAKKRAIEEAEELNEKNKVINIEGDCLVLFISVESDDSEEVVDFLIEDLKNVVNKLKKVDFVVIYPYVHLTSTPANPNIAYDILRKCEERLKRYGFKVVRAPFGWYKSFEIKVKGHPLAELSRKIKKTDVGKKVERKYYIVYPNGNVVEIVDEGILKDLSGDFKILVEKEVFGKELEGGDPIVSNAMKKFGFEWESMSDYGHMRYKPYASIMVDLVEEYSKKVSNSLGIPIYVIKGTNLFDLKEKPIAIHASLFKERMYEVESDKSLLILNYAACFQQFSIAKDSIISYKQIPFGMLEIKDSYRFEKRGELVLGFRTRRFYMPDLHIFCKDLGEAKSWFYRMHEKIMEEIKKIDRDYELLINYGSKKDFEDYKEVSIEIAKKIGKPVLVCVYPYEERKFYWIVNIEYHIIDLLNRPREIGTTQIDVGNGERFGIKYFDENNNENFVIILHNAILGSIERYIYALFDTALRKKKPTLPFWISPVQVRILPVSKDYIPYCEKLSEEIEKKGFRVEIDDRDISLSKKVRDAEVYWVPIVIIVGEREVRENVLSVRLREKNEVTTMSLEELIKMMEVMQKDYPKKERYWPKYLSQNFFLS